MRRVHLVLTWKLAGLFGEILQVSFLRLRQDLPSGLIEGEGCGP